MSARKALVDELRFMTEFRTLFDVTQQASLAQLRRSDERATRQALVTELLAREVALMVPASARVSPWVRGGSGARLLIIMTSDEGLVGPLHASVVRQALAHADDAAHVWLIGQRGARWLGRRAAPVTVLPMPDEDRADEAMRALGVRIIERYLPEGFRDVWLASSRYVSSVRQEVAVQQLLPVPLPPTAPWYEERQLIIEPSLSRFVESLAGVWVEAACQEAFWFSRRAEFAARALHVELSRQELGKRTRLIRYALFKTMHERLDVMVRESCVVQRHVTKGS